MRSLSIVIPSRFLSNLAPCLAAVKEHEPQAHVIVVDDGLDFEKAEPLVEYRVKSGATLIKGEKPFIFSRNCNLGIQASGENDDVILLNDDAILKTPGGFTLLQQAAEEHQEYGVIAATTNNVGNVNQRPKNMGLREDPRQVCFIAVLIPRRTIEVVGTLDERFTAYGFEDDDYCYRTRLAGLKIGIHDGCFVDHASLKSTFREKAPTATATFGNGKKIFEQKWGSHPL